MQKAAAHRARPIAAAPEARRYGVSRAPDPVARAGDGCSCGGSCPRCSSPAVRTTSAPGGVIQRVAWIGAQQLTVNESYKKTVRDTWGPKALARLMELHNDKADHKFASWSALIAEYESAKKAPDPEPEKKPEDVCASLPGFGQRSGSCATASLLTPALIWDREQYRQGDPNPRLRAIATHMKDYVEANRAKLDKAFTDPVQQKYLASIVPYLDDLNARAAADDFQIGSEDYQHLGLVLMFISQSRLTIGLKESEMETARQTLGFATTATPVRFFGDFFKDGSGLAAMKPGEMAQVTWFMQIGQPTSDPLAPKPKLDTHAFTVGRLKDGTWVMNDQGYTPALCLQGSNLEALRKSMLDASRQRTWAGVTDDAYHEPESGLVTGYTVLGDPTTLKK